MILPIVLEPAYENNRDIAAWQAEMLHTEQAILREKDPKERAKYEAFFDHCRKQIDKLKTRV